MRTLSHWSCRRSAELRSIQVDLAARYPRDVEEIVHETCEVSNLPIDECNFLRHRSATAPAHETDRPRDGRERISQFVTEHREELILRAQGTRPLFQQARRMKGTPGDACGGAKGHAVGDGREILSKRAEECAALAPP